MCPANFEAVKESIVESY